MITTLNTQLEIYEVCGNIIRHLPTVEEVKEIVISEVNKKVDQKILEGFVWRDMPIWLSSENQFNYKAAYDLAVQTQGMNLPSTFKFGTVDEPKYHTFETVEELQDFYTSAVRFINDTLAEGWKEKDSFDIEGCKKEIKEKNIERTIYFHKLEQQFKKDIQPDKETFQETEAEDN